MLIHSAATIRRSRPSAAGGGGGGAWQLDSAYWEPSNYPLKIIHPVAGLDTNNRAYRAYPGLVYNIRPGVWGGAYPFHFELTTAPSGMTINEYTGEITWSNPTTSGSPHSVTLRVEDQENSVQTVSWTITVTTSGFYFVDQINGTTAGGGGTGTLANPWKNISDWYEGSNVAAETANSYNNGFLYWRSGTYVNDAYIRTAEQDKTRVILTAKPHVHLAYPGESPIIDLTNGYFFFEEGSNLYIDGLDFNAGDNTRGMCCACPSNATNVVVRNSKFHNFTGTGGGTNAGFYITSADVQWENWTFQDNEFYDVVTEGYGMLGYEAKYLLFENNYCHDVATHGVSPKEGNQYWDIRANHFGDNNNSDAIGLQYSDTGGFDAGDIEIRYNRIHTDTSGNWLRVNSNQTDNGTAVYVYRNSAGGSDAQSNRPAATNGPFYWTKNVITNNNSGYTDRIKVLNPLVPSRVVYSNNLTGAVADGILDANGRLQGTYRTTYLYTRGHEIPSPYDWNN